MEAQDLPRLKRFQTRKRTTLNFPRHLIQIQVMAIPNRMVKRHSHRRTIGKADLEGHRNEAAGAEPV